MALILAQYSDERKNMLDCTPPVGQKAGCANCLIRRGNYLKILWLCLTLVCLLLYGCADGLKDMETSYTVKVTGSEKMKFSGNYSFAGLTGVPNPVHVDAVVPMEYSGRGVAAGCVFRKTTAEGTLKVEILKDGKVASSMETTQPFGVITLGKAPDTNSIINKILGMILG